MSDPQTNPQQAPGGWPQHPASAGSVPPPTAPPPPSNPSGQQPGPPQSAPTAGGPYGAPPHGWPQQAPSAPDVGAPARQPVAYGDQVSPYGDQAGPYGDQAGAYGGQGGPYGDQPVRPDQQVAHVAAPPPAEDQPLAPGGQAPRVDVDERAAFAMNGFVAWLIIAALWVVAVIFGIVSIVGGAVPVLSIILIVLALIMQTSVTVIQPGQAKVLQFFGRYIGTVRRTGLVLTVPWTAKKNVSTKIENFETNQLKVNDADGNPVNIAAIVVWQVSDTAKASFAVEEYHRFVAIQAEAALRHVASQYPYDNAGEGEPTLRESTDVVAARMAEEMNARVHLAGVSIIETRISTLAYAPEIAQAMLQRQQASAIVAAREKILDGAVGMVNGALRQLESTVEMDDHHRAEMVSNLLVVLCSDSKVTPVVNAGAAMHSPRE